MCLTSNRTVVASRWSSCLLTLFFCLFSAAYCRIDGNTAHEDRINAIEEYNKPGSEKFIFLLTTRAGGLGINLATADIVIMYDSDWNPQVDLQAEDRAHRIGQTKQVIVFRFITENAIEEKVIERATQKLKLDQLVIQQGKASQQSKAASKDELLSMIQYGADSVFRGTESTIAEEDIEEILAKGAEKTAELDAKFKDAGIEDLQRFTVNNSSLVWEGEDYSHKRKADHIGLNWIGPAKRERKGDNSEFGPETEGACCLQLISSSLLPPYQSTTQWMIITARRCVSETSRKARGVRVRTRGC